MSSHAPLAWSRQDSPLVIAHRGASAEALENTLPAFRRARELGADGVELDVMRCASGEVVVFHDDDLVRLGHRAGAVRALGLGELRAVELEDGGRIPTLAEALEEIGPELLVNVELKAPERRGLGYLEELRDDGLPAAVARVLERAAGRRERLLVSSFHPLFIARFARAAAWCQTALLFQAEMSYPLRRAWAARVLRPAALHPAAELVTPRAVREWHQAGYAINVWTVDDPREIAWLGTLGVDGVITNRPDLARRALSAPARERRAAGG